MVIGIVVGLIVGGVVAYLGVQAWLKNINKSKLEDAGKQAELLLQSAKLDAKKLADEASIKASKLIDNAERKNDQIKQQKITEARDKYQKLRSEFESDKAKHIIEMKDLEIEVIAKETELNQT